MKVRQIRRKKTKEQKLREKEQKYRRYHETLKFNDDYKAKIAEATRKWQLTHIEKYMLGRSRQAAKKLNLPFNLEVEDIVVPEMCPILNEPLKIGTRYAPSIDRIIPSLGYVKGNVWVISMKANAMKTDATKEELKLFARWIDENLD